MVDILKKVTLFQGLDEVVFKRLEKISSIKSFKKDNIIFFEGDEALYLHILLSGEVEVYKTNSKSNKVVLHHFLPISLIAEFANLESIPFPATSIALTEVTMLLIDFKSFENILLSEPKISIQIIKSLTKKIKSLENTIENTMILNSSAKVAKYLYEHQDDFKKLKSIQIAMKLNMTPETFSRTLKKFKTESILNSDLDIINRDLLQKYLHNY